MKNENVFDHKHFIWIDSVFNEIFVKEYNKSWQINKFNSIQAFYSQFNECSVVLIVHGFAIFKSTH